MENVESPLPRPHRDIGFRTLLTFAALVLVIAGLREASSVILPVLLAGFLAVLSFPPIAWLHRRRMPLWASVLIVFAGVIIGFVLISVFITSSIRDFTENLPAYQARIEVQIVPLLAFAQSHGVEISTDALTDYLNTSRLMSYLGSALGAVSAVLSNTLFVLLTTVFILAEAAGLKAKLRVALGTPEADVDRYDKVLTDLQGYLGIKTQVSLITGVLAGLICAVIGVDYALLWGLVAFLLNFVPTLGSIIAAVPAVLLAFVQFGWQRALIVGIGYVTVNLVMGNVIEPRLMGRRLGLSTLVVFLSLVFWGFVWGPLGMLLCVPLTMLVKILLQNSDDLRWVAVMLGSGAEVREQHSNWSATHQAVAADNVRNNLTGDTSIWQNSSSEPGEDEPRDQGMDD